MAKERIVRAAFSNGAFLERGSVSRTYTHAYLATGQYHDVHSGKPPSAWHICGFSSSEEQCRRNLCSESSWARKHPDRYRIDFEEVVAVEPIAKRGEIERISEPEARS